MANPIERSSNPHPLLQSMDIALSSFFCPYKELYSANKISLASVKYSFDRLQSALKKAGSFDEKMKIGHTLAIERGRCKVYSEAIKEYYNTAKLGQFVSFIEKIFKGVFGCQTSTDEAESLLNDFDRELSPFLPGSQEINQNSSRKQSNNEFEFSPNSIRNLSVMLCRRLADYDASTRKSVLHTIDIGMNTTAPPNPLFLLTKPNGDFYLTTTGNSLGQGVHKTVYAGNHYPFNYADDFSNQELCAVSIFPARKSAKTMLKKEVQPLENFKGTEGIIQIRDSFVASNSKNDLQAITITEKYDCSLEKFLDEHSLAHIDKVRLMQALSSTFNPIHEQGMIHRDLKEANILVNINNPFKPVFIDFENCVDIENYERKKNIVGTPFYNSPEYALATHQLYDGALDKERTRAVATTQAIDIWALGLVFYRIYFEKPLETHRINEEDQSQEKGTTCEEKGGANSNLQMRQVLEAISALKQADIDRVFEGQESDPVVQIIKMMLRVNPWERKLPLPADWPA